MPKGRSGIIGVLGLCLLLATQASAMESDATLTAQRKDFVAAEQALRTGNNTRYQTLKTSLKDYPLYPYLEYAELEGRVDSLSAAQIKRFLDSHDDTPLAERLRAAWLKRQAKQGRWQNYVAFYRTDHSTERHCYYLQALIHTGRQDEALSQAKPLWLQGRSQPDACDTVFEVWRNAGKMTPPLVWQRIALAMEANETRLARYLRRFLSPQEQPWLERWLEIHQNPRLILQPSYLKGEHPYRNDILAHGIRRLARQDAAAALDAWNSLHRSYFFNPEQRAQIEDALALAFIRDEHPDTLDYLDRIKPRDDNLRLQEARIRAALGRGNWSKALAWLQALPESERQSETWSYWQARALEALGSQREADMLYRIVAKERSYYGFLAADRLGTAYHLEHAALEIGEAALQKLLSELPGLQRARELHALDRLTPARQEWEAVVRRLDNTELKAAAKLAQQWGWHDRAIFSLARTGYWDDLELRFPLEHRHHIESHAGTQALDSAWVFAVVRQESAFTADARSHAGALGLMQLMPKTARFVARSLRLGRTLNLLQPALNIQLGTAYLRRVLDDLGQHPVLATAAYNAGPHRVKGWLPAQEMPADIWVETVPFNETRNYLRRVLAYTVIYDQRLGREPLRLENRMPPIGVEETLTSGLPHPSGDRG